MLIILSMYEVCSTIRFVAYCALQWLIMNTIYYHAIWIYIDKAAFVQLNSSQQHPLKHLLYGLTEVSSKSQRLRRVVSLARPFVPVSTQSLQLNHDTQSQQP